MTTDAVPFFTNQLLSIFKSYIDNGLTMVKNYQSRFSDNNKKLQNWRIQAQDDIDNSWLFNLDIKKFGLLVCQFP